MKLRVTLRHPGTSQRSNIQVTADATATPRDLAVSLAGALDQPGDLSGLTLRVADPVHGQVRALEPSVSLVDSGLTSGSVVELGFPEPRRGGERGAAVAVLRVLSGPDTGVEVQLPAGNSSLGRERGCDVRLSDPRVSKRHARLSVGDRVEIIDTNSANGVLVGGVRQQRITLAPGDVVQVGSTSFTIVSFKPQHDANSTDIAFVRSPRVLGRPHDIELALPEPPGPPQRSRFPWLALVAPLLMGTVMYLFTHNKMSVIFVGLSPILMIGTWLTNRVEVRSNQKRMLAEFDKELLDARDQMNQMKAIEVAELKALHPSVHECVTAVSHLTDLVWSRRPEHPEFAQVRLGLGQTRSSIKPKSSGERGLIDLRLKVRQLTAEAMALNDAPVIADLRSVGSLGICGRPEATDGVARGLVTQIASLHSPAELTICCLTSTTRKDSWSWVEWLPHTHSAHSPLPGIHLAADASVGRQIVDQLEELVTTRSQKKQGNDAGRGPVSPLDKQEKTPPPVIPAVLVVVDDSMVDRSRLTRLAEVGPDAGVHLFWVASHKDQLPGACRTYLEVGSGDNLRAGFVRTGTVTTPILCESVDLGTAEAIGRRFAPLIDVGAPVEDQSDLPQSISVMSLLGPTDSDNPEVVLERWRENRSLIRRGVPAQPLDHPADLTAIVGHAGHGPMAIDLRRDGPHALVGGTTGAGKSEFLQAWVLGMAHALSPDRVTFLFVDYKGGSAFAKCLDLPHTVGLVTDLTPYLVRRALTSLKAELRYREHLLNKKGKKDLIELERAGDPECPPSLVIVVDEFAALVTEVPEFVDGMVDVAQRGRSLGLHLILATQRPAGVIKDNLRANTNLRIALRMADEQDSSDVLGTPMAAHFSSSLPGRGAAKTGPGRITTFQSAYPGARTTAEVPIPPIEVTELNFGVGRAWKMPERKVVSETVSPDIERLVNGIVAAAKAGGVPAPRKPWLPELARVYNLAKLLQRVDAELVLGVRDDPDNQRQIPEYYRPDDDGNIMYVGAGGSGKTTALRSLAIAASITPKSGPVHVYGLDFAGGGLSSLEALPNVGSIIMGDDEERVARLFRYLSTMVDERSVRYSAARASTLEEYRRQASMPQEPRILVLIDGFAGFRAAYEMAPGAVNPYTQLARLVVDGRAVGVHLAVSADRMMSVPMAMAAGFQRKIVLRQANADAYLDCGIPKDILNPASPPGRAVISGTSDELQLTILGTNPTALAQAQEIEALARELATRVTTRPTPIRSLPDLIPAAKMPARVGTQPVLGVESTTLQPIGFDPRGVALITGPRQSGRTSALRWCAESLRRWSPEIQLFHLAPRRSVLGSVPGWRRSVMGVNEVSDALPTWSEMVSLDPGPDAVPRFAILIEGLSEFVNSPVEMPLTEMLSNARRNGHIVIAECDLSEVMQYGPVLTEIRQSRTGFLLQPESMDEPVLRTPLPRCNRIDFPPGRGLWIRGGKTLRVQLPYLDA